MGVSEFIGDILWKSEDKLSEDGYKIQAEINVDRRYLRATLSIYPIFIVDWKERGDSETERVIAHEVAHIATAHLYYLATCIYKDSGEMKDAWETLTERIGRLSVKVDELLRKKR